MNPIAKAFSHAIVREPWGLSGPSKTELRSLKDMDGLFATQEDSEREVYRVVSPAEQEPSDLTYAITVIQPGKVGDEFFMTKGHFHRKADSGELYLGLAGSGILLMQDRLGSVTTESLAEGHAVYIPPGVAHRTVNVGKGELAFLAVYSPQAGHDYESIVRRGFTKRVVERDGKAEIVDA
jgi:glucose-6-phosphate isomerase